MYNEGYKRKEYGYGERNISFWNRQTDPRVSLLQERRRKFMGALIATVVVGVIIALFGLKIVRVLSALVGLAVGAVIGATVGVIAGFDMTKMLVGGCSVCGNIMRYVCGTSQIWNLYYDIFRILRHICYAAWNKVSDSTCYLCGYRSDRCDTYGNFLLSFLLYLWLASWAV